MTSNHPDTAQPIVGRSDHDSLVHIYGFVHDSDDEWYPDRCEPGDHDGDEYRNREANVPAEVWTRWNEANTEWEAARRAVIEAAGFEDELPVCDKTDFEHHAHQPMLQVSYPPSGSDDEWPAGNRAIDLFTAIGVERIAEMRAQLETMPEQFCMNVHGHIRWLETGRLITEHRPGRYWLATTCNRCGHLDSDHPNYIDPELVDSASAQRKVMMP